MAHKKPDPSDSRIGKPLGPRIIESIGVLEALPTVPDGFDPNQAWTHAYRIWGTHGYRMFQNKNMGCLKIHRRPGPDDGRVALEVRKELVSADGIVQIIEAELTCRDDMLLTPMSWKVTSSFTDTEGTLVPELSTRWSGRVEDGALMHTIDGNETRQTLRPHYTCDWCLFDVVQRMGQTGVDDFDLLEGLSVIKNNHRLRPLENHQEEIAFTAGPLRCVVHVGRGIVPHEYWIDQNHRLVMVFTGTVAYILDEEAEASAKQLASELRQGDVYYEY